MKMMKKNIGKTVYDVRPLTPSDGEHVCVLYGECGRPAAYLADGHDKGKRHFLCRVHHDTEWVEVQASYRRRSGAGRTARALTSQAALSTASPTRAAGAHGEPEARDPASCVSNEKGECGSIAGRWSITHVRCCDAGGRT